MSSEEPPRRRGLLLVISSPVRRRQDLAVAPPGRRPPRPGDLDLRHHPRRRGRGEQDGREYHFVAATTLTRWSRADAFLEWAEVHEHRYGTPAGTGDGHAGARPGRPVRYRLARRGGDRRQSRRGHRTGVRPSAQHGGAVRSIARQGAGRRGCHLPPSGTSPRRDRQWGDYDYVIVNEDFDRAYADLAAIYRAERLRRWRNPSVEHLVEALLSETLPAA